MINHSYDLHDASYMCIHVYDLLVVLDPLVLELPDRPAHTQQKHKQKQQQQQKQKAAF